MPLSPPNKAAAQHQQRQACQHTKENGVHTLTGPELAKSDEVRKAYLGARCGLVSLFSKNAFSFVAAGAAAASPRRGGRQEENGKDAYFSL